MSDRHAVTHVLVHAVSEVVEGVAVLTDSEETVLALVHPLVRCWCNRCWATMAIQTTTVANDNNDKGHDDDHDDDA